MYIYIYIIYILLLVRPSMPETTALGAAIAAGMAAEVNVWRASTGSGITADTFSPSISEQGQILYGFICL